MRQPEHFDEANDSVPVQIDIYGIKLPSGKADAESPPGTWEEVGRRVNQHLMTLVERFFGVTAEVFVAAGNVARGIGNYFIRKNPDLHHAAADAEEESRQQTIQARPMPALQAPSKPSLDAALENVEELLNELRAKGLVIETRPLGSGKLGLFLLPPESIDVAQELVREEVRQLALPSSSSERQWPLDSIGLSRRIVKALAQANITTINELTELSALNLRGVKGVGPKAIETIRHKLKVIQRKLRAD